MAFLDLGPLQQQLAKNPFQSMIDYQDQYAKNDLTQANTRHANVLTAGVALAQKDVLRKQAENQAVIGALESVKQQNPNAGPADFAKAALATGTETGIKFHDEWLKSEAERNLKSSQGKQAEAHTNVLNAEVPVKQAEARHKAFTNALQELPLVAKDPQSAAAWVTNLTKNGIFDMKTGSAAIQSIPQDPAGLAKWVQDTQMEGVGIAKRTELDLQKARDAASATNMAESRRLQERGQNIQVSEGAKGRAQAMTIANMVDQRQRDIAAERAAEREANKKSEKPLPQKVITELQDARDGASMIASLKDTFDPSFGSKGVLGFGSDVQLAAGSVLGMDKDAVEWWKNYKKQVEIVERHAKFGASLSKNESASWRAADINPGMDPAVIKRNLDTRAKIAAKVLENTAQDYVDAGHPADRIEALAKRTGPSVEKPAGPFSDAEKERRYQEWKAKQK